MTNPGGKWANFGHVSEIGRRKAVRLLLIGDEDSSSDFENYFSGLKECAELCRHMFDVTCNFTNSGVEGKKLMRDWEPNVIIVDAHLHDFNSLEIVQFACTEHLPIVVTSDYPSREIENSAREQGAAGYLTKTDNPDELEMVLKEIVSIANEVRIKH